MYVCIYTCRRVNPIVLSRGRRLGRAAPRYFQFRAAVSSLARSDEAIGNSPRRDFQHFQFARGSSLAGRIHTVTGKEPDGHSFPHSLSLTLSLSFVRPRIEKVRIQMRRNDHGYPGGLLHAPLEDRESLCFPRSESLSDISIAKARRTFRPSRDLHVPLIYPRLSDSPLKTLFPPRR